MKILTFRKPTHLYHSDACEYGLGGYSLISGKAWRFELPVDCRLRTSLNSLEFISCMITLWVDVLSGDISAESCLLSQTDSSTAAGWLKKSNFADKPDEMVQLTTAHLLANLLIETKSCLYSQWFPGEFNIVSDSLSRDFHLPSKTLSNLLLSHVRNQVPFGLTILDLPNEIVSWLTSLLRNQQLKEQWSKVQMPSKFALGIDTDNIYCQLDLKATSTLTNSLGEQNTKSSVLLPKQSERVDFLLDTLRISNLNQSTPPWTAWLRPTSWLTEQIPDSTKMESLLSFYSDSCVDIPL
jgi:hypothetical protein